MDFEHVCLNCMTPDLKGNTCHFCGFDNKKAQTANALPYRKKIAGKYFVGKVISDDGDGFTYMGYDIALHSKVHIREFFPQKIVQRSKETFAISSKQGKTEIFNKELVSFLRLSRSLATVKDLSGIFSVYDIIEENGTAYAISEYVTSMTLEEHLAANNGILKHEKAVSLFSPFLESMILLHAANICHYGISPQTLHICEDGKLRLDSFSLKLSRMDNSDIYNSNVFDGYTALEQYEYDDNLVGKSSDVYSIAAVIFRTFVGKSPLKATARVDNSRLIVPTSIAKHIPQHSLSAIASALLLDITERTATITRFRNEFLDIDSNSADYYEDSYEDAEENYEESYNDAIYDEQPKGKNKKQMNSNLVMVLAFLISLVLFLGIGYFVYNAIMKEGSGGDITTTQPQSTTSDVGFPDGSTMLRNLIGEVYNLEVLKSEYPNLIFEKQNDVFSDRYEKGTICAQEPAGNQEIANGTVIKITVSKGKSTVKVPTGIKGLTADQAIDALTQAGYTKVKRLEVYDGTVEVGKVVRCDPPEGSNYDVNNVVYIHVNVLDPNAE